MCNCNENIPLYNPCNTNPCPPQEDCDCPVKDLSTDCVLYTGNDLECSGILNNTPLTEVIEQMGEFICTKFEETNGALNLINTGDGETIYKGIDGRGRREIKSLKGDEYVSIEDTGDTLNFKINVESITEGISETFLENIGDGIGVYKEKIDNRFLLKSIKEETLGTGEKIFELVDNIDTIDILNSTITTRNLDITRNEDGSLDISTPETEGGLRMFYVNESYTGAIEDGSMVRPYKRLITALREVIGNGTLSNPEIKHVNIRLQSNVGISQSELDAVPALLNKLSVNTLSYSSDGSSNRYFISYEGNTDYPIDFRTLLNQVGMDSDGNLLRSIYVNFTDIEVRCVNVFGIMYFKEAENNTSNQYKTYCGITNTYFNCEYRPSSYYTELKNIDNTNIGFFGNNLKGQNSIPLTTPHVVVEGFDRLTGGTTLDFTNSKIQGSSQVCLKGLNTILNGDLEVSYEGLYQNYELDPNIPNKYLPKRDLNAIEFTNVYFVGSIKDPNAYPYYKGNYFPDLNNKVGGYNSFIKAIRTNDAPIEIPNTISIESWVYSAGVNNFAIVNNIVNLGIYNSDLTSLTSRLGAFATDIVYSSRANINFNGSLINNVKHESISKIRLNAVNATVNGNPYSSAISFANDTAAIAYGLIPGNEYFNSTTNTLQRIPFPA